MDASDRVCREIDTFMDDLSECVQQVTIAGEVTAHVQFPAGPRDTAGYSSAANRRPLTM